MNCLLYFYLDQQFQFATQLYHESVVHLSLILVADMGYSQHSSTEYW